MGVCPRLGGLLQPSTHTTDSTAIPLQNERMESRSFIFRMFLCGYAVPDLRGSLIRKTTVHGHTSCADTPFGYYVRSLPRLKLRLCRGKERGRNGEVCPWPNSFAVLWVGASEDWSSFYPAGKVPGDVPSASRIPSRPHSCRLCSSTTDGIISEH